MEESKPIAPVDPQLNELATANLPGDLKRKIAIEYFKLKQKHPNWKVHKAMKKAGEKHNVNFEFE